MYFRSVTVVYDRGMFNLESPAPGDVLLQKKHPSTNLSYYSITFSKEFFYLRFEL